MVLYITYKKKSYFEEVVSLVVHIYNDYHSETLKNTDVGLGCVENVVHSAKCHK